MQIKLTGRKKKHSYTHTLAAEQNSTQEKFMRMYAQFEYKSENEGGHANVAFIYVSESVYGYVLRSHSKGEDGVGGWKTRVQEAK